MSFTAAGHRYLWTIKRSKTVPWHWMALNLGTAQPGLHGRWNYRVKSARAYQIHITPIHISRWGGQRYWGLCLGARTIYVMRHR